MAAGYGVTVRLDRWMGEPEPADPALAGDWAGVMAELGENPPLPWCWYLARRNGVPVGCGAFKGPPVNGTVEIAYLTFLPAVGGGVATAVAAALVEIAHVEGMATVVAHTLPETNPSTRVLQAIGFTKTGDVVNPDDGPVWRWERAL